MARKNDITIIGNLADKAEYVEAKDNKAARCKFTVIVNRIKRDKNAEGEYDAFPVVIFGKMAESLNQYLEKGKLVSVSGEVRIDRYDKTVLDEKKKDTGFKTGAISLELYAGDVQLLSPKG
jgi:single-strand DNA-binding protein